MFFFWGVNARSPSLLHPSVPLFPSSLLLLFVWAGQGRDGLDWHRLVLGGVCEAVCVCVTLWGVYRPRLWQMRVLTVVFSRSPPPAAQIGAREGGKEGARQGNIKKKWERCVCVLSVCVSVCVPRLLFQEKLTLKCPHRPMWVWFTASGHTHRKPGACLLEFPYHFPRRAPGFALMEDTWLVSTRPLWAPPEPHLCLCVCRKPWMVNYCGI